jgi:hypothetical protein
MEVTKRKREEQGWECRNGLAPPRSDHFLIRQMIAIIANHFCRFVAIRDLFNDYFSRGLIIPPAEESRLP